MSMTTELAQRMKAAAQEATQGEWRWEGDGGFSYLLAEGDTSPENRIIDDGSAWGEYAETISPDSFDAAHIAASCPQNVLELVEALEAAQKRVAELTEFAQHVNKCLLKNGEHAPLSHELIQTVLGIRADGKGAAQ